MEGERGVPGEVYDLLQEANLEMPPCVTTLLLTCSHLDTPSTCADICIHCGEAGRAEKEAGLQLTPHIRSSQAPPWGPLSRLWSVG